MKSIRTLFTILAVLALTAGSAFAAGTPAADAPTGVDLAESVEAAPDAAEAPLLDLFQTDATPVQTNPGCQGEPQEDCFCPAVYDPVCGCNGETYSNDCYARCDGVRFWTEGEC